jgi:hypothetical protein
MFKTMTDEELRTAYVAWRKALSGWSAVAAPRKRDGGRSANGTGRALRNVEIIEAVAKGRGIKL